MKNGLNKIAHVVAPLTRGLLGLAAALAFATSVTVLPAGPAQAAFGDCPQLRLCVFSEPNGTGAMAVFASGDANLGDSVGPLGMNNNIESFINNTGWHCDFWDYANYTGDIRHADAYQGGVNLGSAWANRITSLRCA